MEEMCHPCVMGCTATYADAGHLYFLIENMPGGELFRLLDQMGPFHPSVCSFYLGSIVLALRHMHSLCYVYRDLKPENVLIDRKVSPGGVMGV